MHTYIYTYTYVKKLHSNIKINIMFLYLKEIFTFHEPTLTFHVKNIVAEVILPIQPKTYTCVPY